MLITVSAIPGSKQVILCEWHLCYGVNYHRK